MRVPKGSYYREILLLIFTFKPKIYVKFPQANFSDFKGFKLAVFCT